MKYYIYALLDPITGEIRYIGGTNNPKRRKRDHKTRLNENTHKVAWIKKLKSLGMCPTFFVIEETSIECWEVREQTYITELKALGFDLTNSTKGGSGNARMETYSTNPTTHERCTHRYL
jgi:hypothetical protein